MSVLGHFLHWLAVHTGTDSSPSGVWYNFWSGFGSDIGEIALIGGVIGLYRKHNCHVRGCWRVARHPLEGTPYIVCRQHHPHIPDGGASHQEILDARDVLPPDAPGADQA